MGENNADRCGSYQSVEGCGWPWLRLHPGSPKSHVIRDPPNMPKNVRVSDQCRMGSLHFSSCLCGRCGSNPQIAWIGSGTKGPFWGVKHGPEDVFHTLTPVEAQFLGGRVAGSGVGFLLLADDRSFTVEVV